MPVCFCEEFTFLSDFLILSNFRPPTDQEDAIHQYAFTILKVLDTNSSSSCSPRLTTDAKHPRGAAKLLLKLRPKPVISSLSSQV